MVSFEVKDDKLICSFSEQMNTENCFKIQEEIFKKIRELKKPVIFDMQRVDYVASIFLSICIQISKEVGVENFMLQNVHPSVKKVFKISGLDTHLTII